MITFAKKCPVTNANHRPAQRKHPEPTQEKPAWHAGYLQMLPAIRRQANIRVRNLPAEARADAVQEIVADTVVTYVRLAELGKEDLAYPTPMVSYAVAKFRAGRSVGNRLNVRDVMSKYCQQRKGVVVERLQRGNENSDGWQDVLVEDRHASPADVVMIRMDFREWLNTLPLRTRRIAEMLAVGESSSSVAGVFALTTGRISQLRKELRHSWFLFMGEPDTAQDALPGIVA
jgi:hypothetical protein